MMKKAQWILPLLAALFLVPCAGATEKVVSADGTVYTIEVVQTGGSSPEGTALAYTILHPGGTTDAGTVSPTEDHWGDREPTLVVSPEIAGPLLVWTRNDGLYDQIAYSRFDGNTWSQLKYLTSGARDHANPRVALDSHGLATLAWVEQTERKAVMIGTFDPFTGDVLMAPKDLLGELIRSSTPQWLGGAPASTPIVGGRSANGGPWPSPDGGNDTPAIPPCSNGNTTNCKKDSIPVVGWNPACPRIAAAIVRSNSMAIGLLDGGTVLRYYRAPIPAGAPPEYASMLLHTILEVHCED